MTEYDTKKLLLQFKSKKNKNYLKTLFNLGSKVNEEIEIFFKILKIWHFFVSERLEKTNLA